MKEIILKVEHPQLPPMMKYRRLCLECDLAELAGYYGKPYSLPLCEYLDFTYDRAGSKSIAEHLNAEKNIFELYKNHGMRFEKFHVANKAAYSQYIEDKIKSGDPVIVHLDCFYAPWDPSFGKEHNNHTAIVIGIRDDGYYVSDPYFGASDWVGKDEFHSGSAYYYEIDFGNVESEAIHRNALVKKTVELARTGYFENIDKLSEDLRTATPSSPEMDDIAETFGNIEWNKQKFIMFLYEWETSEGHHRYSGEYSKVWARWQVLKVMCLKAKYRKYDSSSRESIADYLEITLQIEKTVLHDLLEIATTGEDRDIAPDCLDISRYCNNKGLSESWTDGVADCTGFGEYICVKDRSDEIKRRGYDLLQKQPLDNIVCLEQEIVLPNGFVSDSIVFLVAAECGDYNKAFRLVYSDGYSEEKKFFIRDWSVKGEGRVDLGTSHFLENKRWEKFRDHVYADEVTVVTDKNRTLKTVVLPACSNIHIFAVKSEKGEEK